METNRLSTETELHAIFDRFAQKLTSIEKERTANIQRAENKAGIAQSLTASAPRAGIAIIVTIDKKRNLGVSEIEKTATHQRNILFLQAKQELLAHQQTYFESLFETYSNELPSSPEETPTLENLEQCQQIVRQTFDEEQKVFSALGDLEQASEPAIAGAINTVALADRARMRALHPFVEHSINTSLDQAEETSALLRALSQSKNKFLNTQALTAFHEELDQRRANYLSAEPLFNEKAKEIALNNASYLRSKIEEINLELVRTSSEQTKAAAGDQPLFDQKISL